MTNANDHDVENENEDEDENEDELDPDEDVRVNWSGNTLALLFPPFPAPGATDSPALAPHDPVRARRFVESLGTVEEILEQLPDRTWDDVPEPEVRADLDLVAVGCWGNLLQIVDPALASDLIVLAMDEEIARQRERHPQARIVASLTLDYGNTYYEDTVDLPSGESVKAGGWDCDESDGWQVYGDPEEVLRAIGVDRAAAADAGFDLDEEVPQRIWSNLGDLALGGHERYDDSLPISVFRVRRTKRAAGDLEEVWME
ncbi:DUF6333 family protein [Streptomyces chattanoogensis]|uniref:DUF6333 family protein n=1 Tax=Streptomyces chattanoogensis TaxID=66876 RepID=UPI0036AEFCE3